MNKNHRMRGCNDKRRICHGMYGPMPFNVCIRGCRWERYYARHSKRLRGIQ